MNKIHFIVNQERKQVIALLRHAMQENTTALTKEENTSIQVEIIKRK